MHDNLYSELAKVTHTFYRLNFDHKAIADIIEKHLAGRKKIVYFGGFVHVARILQDRGYDLTFVDYTQEMINEAKKVLLPTKFVQSDMRELNLTEQYDGIILMGRVVTYMHSDNDMMKALEAFKQNLNTGGRLIFDNYDTNKINTTDYFTGCVEIKENNTQFRRISKINMISKVPALFSWDCIYEEEKDGKTKNWEDNEHILRAMRRDEIKGFIESAGLKFIENADNFESISFITVAEK